MHYCYRERIYIYIYIFNQPHCLEYLDFNETFHGLTQISNARINSHICKAPVALLRWPLEKAQTQLQPSHHSHSSSHSQAGHLFMLLTNGQMMTTNTHLCVSLPVFQPTHKQAPSHVESSAWRTPRSLSAIFNTKR